MVISIFGVTTLSLELVMHDAKLFIWEFTDDSIVGATVNTLFHLFAIV